jgi:hypothetical protein
MVFMRCTSVKPGIECAFMTAKGCGYKGGICQQIVEQCSGCGRQGQYSSGWYCTACPEPSSKWRNGICNLATHVSAAVPATETKQKINPLKASKRAAGK